MFAGASNYANLVVSNGGRIVLAPDSGPIGTGDVSALAMQDGAEFDMQDDGDMPPGTRHINSQVRVRLTGYIF